MALIEKNLDTAPALPIHNGTFDLAMHAWHEPFDRILALAWDRSISITTPEMGQPFYVQYPSRGEAWWLKVDTAAEPATDRCPKQRGDRQPATTRG